jgi:hypothetical protein
MKSNGSADELARTVAVNALVIGQIFYLINSRFKTDSSLSIAAHLGNRYLPLGIAAVVVLQLLFTYAPPLQRLFGTAGVPVNVWGWLFLGGFVFFLIVEAEKFFLRTFVMSPAPAAAPARTAEIPRHLPGTADGERPPRLSGRWQALLGALAVAGLIGGELYVWRHGGGGNYLTETVTRAHDVKAEPPQDVLSQIPGRISEVLCQQGEKVAAGQPCAKIDAKPFEEAAAREKSALQSALQRQDANARAASKAKEELDRQQQAPPRNAKAQAALTKARTAVERAGKRAEADASAVDKARAALAAAEANLAHTSIAAPVAGTIAAVAAVGAEITQAGPPVFAIAPDPGDPAKALRVDKRALDYGAKRSARENGANAPPEGWSRLWVARGGGAPSPVDVRPGHQEEGYVVILEGDLMEGDAVVVDDPSDGPP